MQIEMPNGEIWLFDCDGSGGTGARITLMAPTGKAFEEVYPYTAELLRSKADGYSCDDPKT